MTQMGHDRPTETATTNDRSGLNSGPKRARAPMARMRRFRSFAAPLFRTAEVDPFETSTIASLGEPPHRKADGQVPPDPVVTICA
jgi:hypothetical protein